jgi:hypothetical protein
VALAVAAASLPTSPDAVERFYSTGVYAALQSPITRLSNLAAFALFDVLIIAVLGMWLVLAGRDLASVPATGWRRAAGRVAGRTAVWVAGLYLAFFLVWGLNYRRTPLIERLAFDEQAVTADALQSLALTAVGELNRLHAPAHEAGWLDVNAIDPVLVEALVRTDRETGGPGVVRVARPKATLLDWYFRRTATDGMTNPYLLETLVATTLLPFERPFVVAHEWSHLAGLADEGDANFVAWLACVRASPPSQYSGWLFLYSELAGAMDADVRADVAARLAAGPRGDLAAIRTRIVQQVSPRLATAGRRVYDRYLKANRVESGIASYGHVVRLVLGVRFGPDWTLAR